MKIGRYLQVSNKITALKNSIGKMITDDYKIVLIFSFVNLVIYTRSKIFLFALNASDREPFAFQKIEVECMLSVRGELITNKPLGPLPLNLLAIEYAICSVALHFQQKIAAPTSSSHVKIADISSTL